MTATRRVWKGALKFSSICAFAIVFKDYICEPAVCQGDSMLPTLNSQGDVVLVEKISHRIRSLHRGDVIVSISPEDPEKLICKRIIGLESDHVTTFYGGLFSNQVKIPKGYVWLEGDNPARSRDSRDFGPVPCGLIQGRALIKVFLLLSICSNIYRFGPYETLV